MRDRWMAYDAVVSLKHTLEHLMNPCDCLHVPSSKEIIKPAYEEVSSLHEQLKMLDRRKVKTRVDASLDEGLREALHEIEDLIESHVSIQLASQSGFGLFTFLDFEDLRPQIHRFTATLKKMICAYEHVDDDDHDDDDDEEEEESDHDDDDDEEEEEESDHDDDDDDDDDDDNDEEESDYDDDDDGDKEEYDDGDSGGNVSNKIVGFSDLLSEIKEILIDEDFSVRRSLTCSVIGMAGIGKTTLANQIFEHPDIVQHFDCRAWFRVGRKRFDYIEIARRIFAQLDPDSVTQTDTKMIQNLKRHLKSKRCLIVLDDVWDYDITEFFRRIDGSHVLFTTRLYKIQADYKNQIPLLNKEESWDVLCDRVFGEELCPRELVKPGKKIAEKCEGLPLLIVTVANLLSKTEINLENWNEVVEDKENQLFNKTYKEIEKVLFPSYDSLPQYLKTCFLYMGVFPQDYEIPASHIQNLWTAEGFVEATNTDEIDLFALRCLEDLIWNSVVLVYQRKSFTICLDHDEVKACGLHSTFWHLCNEKAEKSKFLHVFSSHKDGLEEVIKGHRRLCIHSNVLFGIKEVYSSIESVCAPTARSLLCYGPYHQYEVPMCFGLRLVKVLDALAIRFYDFPLQVLKLVLLRYLSLTCNGVLPPSITNLGRLQFLIVGRHLSIKSSTTPSYLPMEIWNMKRLNHLQIMGGDLPDPCCDNPLLRLLKLAGVGARSCTKEVLERIPNLEKLGILIELEPNDSSEASLRCFDHISHLSGLHSLKCVVANPIFATPAAAPLFSTMPSSLRKLHLSGLGYSWEYLAAIVSLPNLVVLKLRNYAFQGPKWEIQDTHFPCLNFLLIEDTDLVQLEARRGGFRRLTRIVMKDCYRLQELHLNPEYVHDDGSSFFSLGQIELVDCNPAAVRYIQQKIQDGSTKIPDKGLLVHSSWKDGNFVPSQPRRWPKRKFLKPQ